MMNVVFDLLKKLDTQDRNNHQIIRTLIIKRLKQFNSIYELRRISVL